VNVAGLKTPMHNGVFLMEDRRSLDVHGEFEGILGLGLPHHNKLSSTAIEIPSFMDKSPEVIHYTLCFNQWPHPGALRTSNQGLKNPMTNIGTVHWGLELQGMSVGDTDSPVVICDPKTVPNGQKTACGAIPDSGTTLMMGPADQIHSLYASLCDKWSRCQKIASEAKWTSVNDKAKAFHNLLSSCESWMTDKHGIGEVPSVFIHVAGTEGQKQTVELSAWSFVVETTEDLFATVSEKLFGVDFVAKQTERIKATNNKKVCSASFAPQDYSTPDNGPVWILGAPTFYANTVGYSVGGDKGGQISFMEDSCKPCDEKASLLSAQGVHTQRQLRKLDEQIRQPGFLQGPL